MIARIISMSVRHPWRVIAGVCVLCALTLWSLKSLPFDALPEITDPQVLVEIVWEAPTGRLDRDIARPISESLMTVPGVRRVRTMTEMGYGFVYAILDDGADPRSVRSEIAIRLQNLAPTLPKDASVRIGPDASSVGWIYQYVLTDTTHRHDLRELYDLQTRRIAPILAATPGVAEVATLGGLKRQIQIQIYPSLLVHYRLTLADALAGVRSALAESGGRMAEVSGRDFQITASAPIQTLDDLEQSVIGKTTTGASIRLRDIGFVRTGYDIRRGIADLNGDGEVVGGIVVMRQGENALNVLKRIREKAAEERANLPPDVEWTVVYDRSVLIHDAISKMGWTLAEEFAAVALVCIVFLLHVRSALVPILVLPVVCLIPFLLMRIAGVPVHLPVLAGIALALGEIVDAVLVMVENTHKKLAESGPDGADSKSLTAALAQVGRPLFFSLAIILFSFLPVFLLEAQEGRLFRPLAWAKTFAMAASVGLSITLGPALIVLLLRNARVESEEKNPVNRGLISLYAPTFRWAMRHRVAVLILNVTMLAAIPFWFRMEQSFMPPLEEGSILYMPSTLPGLPLRDAGWILQKQDALIRSVPEIETVFGKAGRAETPTDPAPISMIETTITLKPKSKWRPGVTIDGLTADLDRRMQFPGWINAWTQPIRGRMDMLATGIRTEVGVILYSDDLGRLADAGAQTEKILAGIDGVRNAYAERPTLGYFLDVQFDRAALGRGGLSAQDAEDYLRVAMGGAEVARFSPHREKGEDYTDGSDPVTVLFVRDSVDEIHKIEELQVSLPDGTAVPLSKLGAVRLKAAPSAIRRENARWATYVHADIAPGKSGSVVSAAQSKLSGALLQGVQAEFVGQFQYRDRAVRRFLVVVPIVLLIIFWLLQQTFHSWSEALILMLSVPAAMAGGIVSQAIAGYPTTIAVLVGYIALYAVAVQTGVVMVVYLKESVEEKQAAVGEMSRADLEDAVFDGAVKRLRPKLMTVATTILGFVPILWAEGPGAEMLRHIAVPMIGGMVTSTLHVLYLTPILFLWMSKSRKS